MVRTKLNNVDDTMNFWVGCNPVSEGCAHCYARKGMKRTRFDSNQVTRTKSWNTKPYALQRRHPRKGAFSTYSRAHGAIFSIPVRTNGAPRPGQSSRTRLIWFGES